MRGTSPSRTCLRIKIKNYVIKLREDRANNVNKTVHRQSYPDRLLAQKGWALRYNGSQPTALP